MGGTNKLDLTGNDIETYSTQSPLAVEADVETPIHIGGILTIHDNLDEAGFGKRYEGDITVTVDYQ